MAYALTLLRGEVAYVDDADAEIVRGRRWRAQYRQDGEVMSVVSGSAVKDWALLHRLITNAPKGMVVDHIDRDPLNNTRANLRVCTQAENMRNRRAQVNNSTGCKGVRENRNLKRPTFTANISIDGKRHHLGSFRTKEEAAAAYAEAAKKYHGEFARAA